MYNTRSEPEQMSCNYGLRVIMMCQCGFTDPNQCTILVQMLTVGRLCVLGSKGCVGNLYFLLSFTVNLKLPLKIQPIK